jgi:hypothetical protein
MQNKRTQTSVTQVGFEPTIPVFERVNTVHVLEGAATVIGTTHYIPRLKAEAKCSGTPLVRLTVLVSCVQCTRVRILCLHLV